MNSESYRRTSGSEPLGDGEIVYRALLRKQWLDRNTGEVSPDAYFLRKSKNEQGLSVRMASACTPEEFAARFRNCYGIASLKVGGIRSLGLDVIPDSPSHAQILGLPYREDDRNRADRLAELLAKQSSIVWLP
ncbi:MAG: hypothetical protein F6J93_18360 [Oscillatoria sp. SIO1A7]|nr:hypothetical protein [Oscillatoria sp. SIO1A7]